MALRKLQQIQKAKSRAEIAGVDPVEYCQSRLGLKLWRKQIDLIRSTWANKVTGCISGQKTGKTLDAAGIAITWCKLHPRGIVRLASASEDQLIDGLWGEIRTLILAHPELGPVPNLSPSTGWRLDEHRKIVGVTAKEANRMAGRSGPEQLWIVDEACGIDYPLWEVILGNLMGGGHLLWLTNPVTIGGKVYDWDTKPDSSANIIRIDARETPNFPELPDGSPNPEFTGELIPGLAEPSGVEMIRRDYGEESAEFDVRVRGRFPRQGSNAVIPLSLVEDGMARTGDSDGPLVLGVDVARFGDDDSSINPRRNLQAFEPIVHHGLDTIQLAGEVRLEAERLRIFPEDVTVAIDTSGLGQGLYDVLAAGHPEWMVLVAVNAAEKALNEEEHFNRRTELWFSGREWLKNGGALPKGCQRLKGELVAPLYSFDPKGRRKVESKDDIKKRTKRSPDVADGFLLSLVTPQRRMRMHEDLMLGASRWAGTGRGF